MKLKELKLNKRRYKRPGFAEGEFLVIKFIGRDWIVADNEAGKEVMLARSDEKDDGWEYFDDEILYPEEPRKKFTI